MPEAAIIDREIQVSTKELSLMGRTVQSRKTIRGRLQEKTHGFNVSVHSSDHTPHTHLDLGRINALNQTFVISWRGGVGKGAGLKPPARRYKR